MEADLLVKDCRVVKPDVVVDCGLAIRDGSIAAVLRPGETVPARRTIDAGGRFVIPGLLDTHLHLGNAAQSFASDCALRKVVRFTKRSSGCFSTMSKLSLPWQRFW
jgi:predicted amidohydrolase YtcJ